ncbi:MAG: FecR domain-containing protein [Proteobacteria bacterium]|nr:FecR domain-containing protein [Pseudomonadota bacterium]
MAQQDSDVVGKVTRIEKAAVALQDAIPRPLAIGSGIQLGDIISTGKGARLEFEMNDGSKVQLGERSKFVVLEFIVNNNGGNAVMRMIEGAFAVSSGKLMQLADASMTVKTESATIGIRGTTFWGGMIDGTFEVALLAGKSIYVETKAGRVDIDKIGEGSRIVSANEAPSKPAQWPAGKLERAKATVKFSN